MSEFTTREELLAGLAHILASPSDEGVLEGIVTRPEKGQRVEVERCELSGKGGVAGDHWAKGSWKSTDDGQPHPDVQVSLMNTRCLGLIARERNRWPLAGDNLLVDLNLSPENAPPGQRIAVGNAIIEITDIPHMACASFIERYGRDAGVFVNTGDGRTHMLRGRLGRIVQDGLVSVGDRVVKLD
ncbi:MAG: hypothetical protein MPJ78_11895 [Hyphomicrobiaceae bacterium]|nr:hypothetical protein [Hyphomicrobiaceae bacterium]